MQKSIFPTDRENAMQVFTFPEAGRVVEETPPCLCWIPPKGEHAYTVTVFHSLGHYGVRAACCRRKAFGDIAANIAVVHVKREIVAPKHLKLLSACIIYCNRIRGILS